MVEERGESNTFRQIANSLIADGIGFRFQARGRSMWPIIGDGEIIHVRPVQSSQIKIADIVLFRDGKSFKAHRVVRKQGDLFVTRGDTGLEPDGVIRGGGIVGKVIAKECASTGATVPLGNTFGRLNFFMAEARRRARRHLSRYSVFAKYALFVCFLSFLLPSALAQVALDAPAPFTLTSVANAAGGNTVYTGTITGGAGNAFVGVVFTIAGFTTAADNGTFTCTASTATTLTLNNAAGAAQTHAATATASPTSSIAQAATQATNTVTLAHNTIAGSNLVLVVGVSLNTTAVLTLTSANAASGGNTVYNGTITGGGGNAFAGLTFTVAGFTGPGTADNGTFTCTASTATTLTLNNAAGVARTQAATATTTSFGAISGVTYNGVALTQAVGHSDTSGVRRVEMWYLVAPATGNHNVVVTENLVSGGIVATVVGATTFTGADQGTPIRATASNDSKGTASDFANVTVSSGSNDMVLDTLAIDGSHAVTSASGTQVQQWARTSGATAADVYGYGSSHGGVPSVPMSENLGANIVWADAALSIQPVQADVAVSVSGNSTLFPANLTYTITVTNNGPTTSAGVALTDTLPSGHLCFFDPQPGLMQRHNDDYLQSRVFGIGRECNHKRGGHAGVSGRLHQHCKCDCDHA
jgi:uncharacterized repeat protein (TIGR01451 family)